jgi:PAS domain S-box-containing protein
MQNPNTNHASAPPAHEAVERLAAWERGRWQGSGSAGTHRRPLNGQADSTLTQRAFVTLADNVRDYAVFLLDPDGVITYWGEGARLIKWWSVAEAEGGHLRMLYPDGGSEDGTAEEHLIAARERGEYSGEGHRMRNDCSTFWAGVTLTALRDEDGALLGFVKVTRDLTARRAADAVLQAAVRDAEDARREAEEANRAKGQFLATMSHEIRTPINAAMGYAALLDMEIAGPINENQRLQLQRIRASNNHLLGIIDEILEFSRFEAGRVPIGGSAGRIGVPIEAAVQLILPQAQEKGVAISDSVSGYAADVPYWGDEDRVRQVLLALLANAVKFTPSGGRITLSAGTAAEPPQASALKGAGPWVYVRVEDTGEGIPTDRVRAVFEPFEQADMTLTRSHGGTGLGLTIARRLALLMDGDLTVRSEEGVGSTFFLWLPAAAAEALDSTLARTDVAVPVPTPGLLRRVHDAILLEIERILHAYVARLRSDPGTTSAHALSAAELENHLASFLSDLAATFSGLDLAAGADSLSLRDSTGLARDIAERHGRQRQRLGWRAEELRREFAILREEVADAIRRRVPDARPEELDGALDAVHVFITAAQRASMARFRKEGG